jgi:hypothetical protein
MDHLLLRRSTVPADWFVGTPYDHAPASPMAPASVRRDCDGLWVAICRPCQRVIPPRKAFWGEALTNLGSHWFLSHTVMVCSCGEHHG